MGGDTDRSPHTHPRARVGGGGGCTRMRYCAGLCVLAPRPLALQMSMRVLSIYSMFRSDRMLGHPRCAQHVLRCQISPHTVSISS